MDWNKYGYVISSEYRKKVITSLLKSPKTPKQITTDTNLYLSHVSKTLNELASAGNVICLTPKLKRGRIYELTRDGKEIAKYLMRKTK